MKYIWVKIKFWMGEKWELNGGGGTNDNKRNMAFYNKKGKKLAREITIRGNKIKN